MKEIKNDTPFAEALDILGISFSDLISKLQQSKEKPNKPLGTQFTLRTAIEKYLKYFEANYLDSSIKTYKLELLNFERFMKQRWHIDGEENHSVANIDILDIKLYLSQKKINEYTYNKKLAILSSFFAKYLLHEKNYILKAPTKNIKRKSAKNVHIKYLTENEQKKVLQQALKNKETGKRDFFIFFLGLNTGLRLEELVNLNIKDIIFEQNIVKVLHGKGDVQRNAYISNETKRIIKQYINTVRLGPFKDTNINEPLFTCLKGDKRYQRLSKDGMEKMIVRTFRKCGVNTGAAHRLRHTYAIKLLEHNVNPKEIQILLGHKNISSTIGYLQLDQKDVLEKIKKQFPLAFISINNFPDFLDQFESAKMKKLLTKIGVAENEA